MAIVKFGPTVVGARGTIAGTIFSANQAGPFARGWSRGSNPTSTLQSAQRGRFGALAAAWRDLTQVQRDDWIDYADDPAQELTNSLGETYFISGFNWSIKINDHLEAAGEARRVDAPTLVRPLAPILTDAGVELRTTAGGNDTRIRLDAASPNLGFNHVVIARITGEGRTAIAAGFKSQRIAVPDGTRRVFFQPQIESTFGTIALLQRMFVQVRTQDSHGQRSPLDATFADAQS
ncbi:hypothetical protein LCGC14_1225190 [marine sediment metagenome]|uniref:Uncharacterized protein n=1 Tax=marine sediment metagenome TaxID=412755 RepID=A0A0F9NSI8_9ZZZZ